MGAHHRIERHHAGDVRMGDVRAREEPRMPGAAVSGDCERGRNGAHGDGRRLAKYALLESCDQGDVAAVPSRATLASSLDRGRHHPRRL